MKRYVAFLLAALFIFQIHVCMAQQQKVTYIYSDPQGTAIAEADDGGNINSTYEYLPYGIASPDMDNPRSGPGYTGQVIDSDSGLTYMQARYYDAATQRFYSTDPVGVTAGNNITFNRYSYANNNPILYIDPDGRQSAMDAGLWMSESLTIQKNPKKIQQLNEENAAQLQLSVASMVGLTATPSAIFVARTAIAVAADSAASGSLTTGLFANGPAVVASTAIVSEVIAAVNGIQGGGQGAYTAISLEARETTFSANQIKADMTSAQAIENLAANGYAKSISQDGTVTIMTKGDNTYRFYPESTGGGIVGTQTGVSSASLSVSGVRKPITKIRFDESEK